MSREKQQQRELEADNARSNVVQMNAAGATSNGTSAAMASNACSVSLPLGHARLMPARQVFTSACARERTPTVSPQLLSGSRCLAANSSYATITNCSKLCCAGACSVSKRHGRTYPVDCGANLGNDAAAVDVHKLECKAANERVARYGGAPREVRDANWRRGRDASGSRQRMRALGRWERLACGGGTARGDAERPPRTSAKYARL